MRLLLAEDDPRLLKSLIHIFETNRFVTDGVDNGEDALSYALSREYDGLMSNNNILNVGVGNGHEAMTLFSRCEYVTFVDIAQVGLQKIKEKKPLSKIVVANADNLTSIPDNMYDLYVSLRTFNSSFFDIKKAISEAHRVLKPNAIIIVSVANGFLCSNKHCIIPGLIIPGTEFVDIYRGMDTVKLIQKEFLHAGFNNIRFFPTDTELYLSATNIK